MLRVVVWVFVAETVFWSIAISLLWLFKRALGWWFAKH